MDRGKHTVLSAVMAALVTLVLLSVIGAFWGADRATQLFNSAPMKIFWILLAALLSAGLIFFPKELKKPGFLAMHLGCLLVIAGGMLGSRAGHALMDRLGVHKVRFVMVAMQIGDRVGKVIVDADSRQPYLADLPFEVELKDAWTEHYEPAQIVFGEITENGAKVLAEQSQAAESQPASQPSSQPSAATEESNEPPVRWQPVDWRIGQEVKIGDTGVLVKVLSYLKSARAVAASSAPEKSEENISAAADSSAHAPAVEVEISRGDVHLHRWLVAKGEHVQPMVSLAALFPGMQYPPVLALAEPAGTVKAYQSRVIIYKDGKPAAEKTISVNDPLHYGGYAIYQSSFSEMAEGTYVALAIHSDSGRTLVHAGLALLVAGAIWQFYVRPLARPWAVGRRL